MKRWVAISLAAAMLTLGSGVARAADPTQDEYEDSVMHPLRLAAYLVHPIGFAAEWLIGRPFHYIISRPYLDRVFGYQRTSDDAALARYGDRL